MYPKLYADFEISIKAPHKEDFKQIMITILLFNQSTVPNFTAPRLIYVSAETKYSISCN